MNRFPPVTDAKANGNLRAAIYARVSTLNGQDLELQLRVVPALATDIIDGTPRRDAPSVPFSVRLPGVDRMDNLLGNDLFKLHG